MDELPSPDPKVIRIKEITAEIDRHREQVAKLALERKDLILKCRADGYSLRGLGDEVGMSYGRIAQTEAKGREG